jgi:hypothetical protein
VPTLVHPTKIQEGIYSSCQCPVQPPPPLKEELCGGFWNISFGFARGNVGEMPFLGGLRDEFEGEDAVFGCRIKLRTRYDVRR